MTFLVRTAAFEVRQPIGGVFGGLRFFYRFIAYRAVVAVVLPTPIAASVFIGPSALLAVVIGLAAAQVGLDHVCSALGTLLSPCH